MSNKLDEIKGLTDKNIMLFIGFWSNRGNVEHSDTTNIQSDMLFYLNSLMYYKKQSEELRRALEDVADYQHRWSDSPIREVQKIARQALGKEQTP